MRAEFSSLLSVLLALQDADHLPQRRTIFYSDRRSPRPSAGSNSQRSEMDSGVGRESDRWHGRIASRLGHFETAQLGRPVAGLLLGRGQINSRREDNSQARQSRSGAWFERLVRIE